MNGTTHAIEDIFPPTPLQMGMLYHAERSPNGSQYIQQYSLHGRGRMDPSICRAAWEAVTTRHPALRTSFHWKGLERPHQVVRRAVKLPFLYEDLARMNKNERTRRVEYFLVQDSRLGFDLATAPLLRIALHRLDRDTFRMTMTLQHIISDGWSIGIALSEFAAAYGRIAEGIDAGLGTAPSLKAYVRHVAAKPREESLRWWAQRLRGVRPCLPMVDLRREGFTDTADSFAQRTLSLSGEETQAMVRAASAMGVTLNTVFLGAWLLTLALHSGQNDILTGVTVASRPAAVPNVEETFGLLLNIVPLRADCPGTAVVGAWLNAIQDHMAEASEHDHLPLGDIRALCARPDEGFLETLAVFENMPAADGDTLRLGFTFHEVSGFEKTSYPLTMVGYPGDRLRLALLHNRGEFPESAVAQLLESMRRAMAFLAQGPQARLLDFFAAHAQEGRVALGRQAAYPEFAPWRMLEALDTADGAAAALLPAQGPPVTRRELADTALAIASGLAAKGVGPGQLVALRLDAGTGLIAAMLGVWRLGAAWTPLPPTYPPAQAAEMLHRARPDHVLSTRDLWLPVIEACGDRPRRTALFLEDVLAESRTGAPLPASTAPEAEARACLLHTSGSTGFQKGIDISFRALGNRLHWMWEELPWGQGERACQKTSPAFVDYLWETFGALLAGVPLVLVDAADARDPQELVAILERRRVTRLIVVPSLLGAMHSIEGGLRARLPDLRFLTCSGEALSPGLAQRTRRDLPEVRLFNLYGCAEVMGDATWHEVTEPCPGPVPIGEPIANTDVAVLDGNRLPVPAGTEGQIHVAGSCLASGYGHDREATAKAFIPGRLLPFFPPQRPLWFATGDRGWTDEAGRLFFAGREDSQCKIRGVRVEPEEIREALLEHPRVLEAVVLTPEHEGSRRIVVYVQPSATPAAGSADEELADIRRHVTERLPLSMRPHAIVAIRNWPMTPSGKINTRALPPAFGLKDGPAAAFANEAERQLAKIWEATLGRAVPHREADFFDLGGDSLSITRLAFALSKTHAHPVAIKDLYAHSALEDMARFLASGRREGHRLHDIPLARRDVALADGLTPTATGAPAMVLKAGARVLATGAPGFIGLWILAALLEVDDVTVRCLEPCATAKEGLQALRARLTKIGCWQEGFAAKLEVVPGFLDRPGLGLGDGLWERLARETDLLVHSGFNVNLAQSYAALRPANVLGTCEALRLACQGGIPVHYVGSTSIVDFVARTDESAPVKENDPFTSCEGIQTGYILSRWVADHMVRRAGERGLPVAVYRMTTVGGDARSHYCDTGEIYWRLLRVFAQTGFMPGSRRLVDMVPVDQAARAVVALASQPDCYGKAFHMNSRDKLPWETMHKNLVLAGYAVDMIPPEQWTERLRRLPPDAADDNLRILLSMINDDGYDANTSLALDCAQTTAALERAGCSIAPISDELFQRYLARMIQQGWLPEPGNRTQQGAA